MVFEINKLFGLESNSNAVIIGSGPSLNLLLNHNLEVGFWLGDAHTRTEIQTKKSYYVRANSEYPDLRNQSHVETLKQRNFEFIFAQTVMESSESVAELLDKHFEKQSYVFDQRHFGRIPCQPRSSCCLVLDGNADKQTIQEYLADIYALPHHYSAADTVALHAFACALIAGCKKISLLGIEMPFWQNQYVYLKKSSRNAMKDRSLSNSNSLKAKINILLENPLAIPTYLRAFAMKVLKSKSSTVSTFAPDFPRIFSDFQYLIDLAIANDVEVFYCSSSSNLRHLNGIKACEICKS